MAFKMSYHSPQLAGVCTINPVPNLATNARTNSLTIVGEHDGGRALLGAGFVWRCRDRVHLLSDVDSAAGCERSTLVAREGDHSLRWWAAGATDKDGALQSADTVSMNKEVALVVKAFFEINK